MQARRPGFADRLENLLDQLELVGREGVIANEVVGVLERLERGADVGEAELVLEDVALGRVKCLQGCHDLAAFRQQALLDDLVHVGAGQRQPGFEPALDFGEVVGRALFISPSTASMSSWLVTTTHA